MRLAISDHRGAGTVAHHKVTGVVVMAMVALSACASVGDDADDDPEEGTEPTVTAAESSADTGDSTDNERSITGPWVLVDADGCSVDHPDEVTFTDDGIYTVVHEGFSLWGGGDYEIEASQLFVQDQRDAMVSYSISFDGDDLVLVGEEECTVRYRRS